jgi:hypothetical protein
MARFDVQKEAEAETKHMGWGFAAVCGIKVV